MKTTSRWEAARERAESYAPRPKDTGRRYGVLSVGVLLIALAAFSAFYGVNLWSWPLPVAALAGMAFAAGLLIWWVQMRRHLSAHRFEFGNINPGERRHDDKDICRAEG